MPMRLYPILYGVRSTFPSRLRAFLASVATSSLRNVALA